jgi:hypothetical protein
MISDRADTAAEMSRTAYAMHGATKCVRNAAALGRRRPIRVHDRVVIIILGRLWGSIIVSVGCLVRKG